jgi:hypothetical protein
MQYAQSRSTGIVTQKLPMQYVSSTVAPTHSQTEMGPISNTKLPLLLLLLPLPISFSRLNTLFILVCASTTSLLKPGICIDDLPLCRPSPRSRNSPTIAPTAGLDRVAAPSTTMVPSEDATLVLLGHNVTIFPTAPFAPAHLLRLSA